MSRPFDDPIDLPRAPWDWRHRSTGTIILGTTSVPVNAQGVLLKP
jgi:hypothetical protein